MSYGQKVFRQMKSTDIGDTFREQNRKSDSSQLDNSTVIHHLEEEEEEAQKNPPLELRAKGKRRPLTASHVSIKIRLERNVLINKWANEGACPAWVVGKARVGRRRLVWQGSLVVQVIHQHKEST